MLLKKHEISHVKLSSVLSFEVDNQYQNFIVSYITTRNLYNGSASVKKLNYIIISEKISGRLKKTQNISKPEGQSTLKPSFDYHIVVLVETL